MILSSSDVDVISYADESGARGTVRNLKPDSDAQISLLCAIPVPIENLQEFILLVRPHFEKFRDVAPSNAKLHITDAFQSGNKDWMQVAYEVRSSLFEVIKACRAQIVYVARRIRIARETHKLFEALQQRFKDASEQLGPATHRVIGSNQPDHEQVDDRLMFDFCSTLEIFMQAYNRKTTDIIFDQLAPDVIKRYSEIIDRAKNVGRSVNDIRRRNLETGSIETLNLIIECKSSNAPNCRHLGSIQTIGKNDPLIFLTDLVSNSLWRHLSQLPDDATLNDKGAVTTWELGATTFCYPTVGGSPLDRW